MVDISSDDYLTSPRFSPRERAAVLWAEHVAKNTAGERDDVFEEVKKHFNDTELVELTAASGQFIATNRVHDSLHIPLEDHSEVEKIKGKARAYPEQIKASIEKLLEHWPSEFPTPAKRVSDAAPITAAANSAAASSRIAGRAALPSRVPLPDPKIVTGDYANFFDACWRLFGGTSNAVRMWSHIPHVAKFFFPYQAVMLRDGAGNILPITLKMMVLVRTGHLNSAAYSLAHRTAAARVAGITADQFAALAAADCSGSPHFSPSERAALLWADHIAANTAKRRNDVFDRLKQHYNDAEIVELTGLCAMANQLDRIYNALHLPLEDDSDVAALNRTIQLDPAQVKAYLEMLVARWPTEFPVPAD